MKILQKEFNSKGFHHKQLIRRGNIAIFERSKGTATHLETIIIGSHNGYTLAGVYIEPSETYPSTANWGSRGWTFTNNTMALAKMEALEKKAWG